MKIKHQAVVMLLLSVMNAGMARCEVYSGTCGAENDGSNVSWSFDTNSSTLTLAGQGRIYSYDYGHQPWLSHDVKHVRMVGSIRTVPAYLFYNSQSLLSIELCEGLDSIGYCAFYQCQKLEGFKAPRSLKHIGDNAFFNCTQLTTAELGDSILTIGASAFRQCSRLRTISLPPSLTTLGWKAFYDCTELDSVMFNARNCRYMGNGGSDPSPFYCAQGTWLRTAFVGDSVLTIPQGLFYRCAGLKRIHVGRNVQTIGQHAFPECDYSPCQNNLDTVYINALTPPASSAYVDDRTTIQIPCGTYDDYAAKWNIAQGRIVEPSSGCKLTVFYTNSVGMAQIIPWHGQLVTCDSLAIVYAYPTRRGWHFSHWSTGSTDSIAVVKVEKAEDDVTAYFERDKYFVSAAPFNNETNKGRTLGSDSVLYADSITLTAVPSEHYSFNYWKCYTNGQTYTDNPLRLQVLSPLKFEAFFKPDRHSIRVLTNDSLMGTGYGTGQGDYGDTYIVSPKPNTHYHFVSWSDGDTNGTRYFTLTQDTTFTAIYAPDRYYVQGKPNMPERGTVLGSDSCNYKDSVMLVAVPAHGYHFDHWSGGRGTSDTIYVRALGSTTVTAYFEKNSYQVYAAASDTTQGSVQGSGNYAYLDTCGLTALPAFGYHFERWSDGSTDNPHIVVVMSDTALWATFAKDTFYINAVALLGETGSVSGFGYYAYGDTATLTAIPANGYRFEQWTDGNADNPRHIVVLQSETFTAMFADDHSGLRQQLPAGIKITAADGSVNIHGAEGLHVALFTADGKQISSVRRATEEVCFTHLPQGIYIVRIGTYSTLITL